MGIINKLLPLLEIDLGTKKLFYSTQACKVIDGNSVKQFDGKLKSESGINKSFSLTDFKASVSVANNVSIINEDRLQDIFSNNPESFTKVKLTYMFGGDLSDTTSKILDIYGIASNPSWNQLNFSMSIKDSQKLFFKNVPEVILDSNTFQTSFTLNDATMWTAVKPIGFMTTTGVNSSRSVTMVTHIVSSSFNNKPENYWKGSRVDIAMDQRLSDDTNNMAGHFAVVVYSKDATVFFNSVLDRLLLQTDETAFQPTNNSMFTGLSEYSPTTLTIICNRRPIPQNADNGSIPFPILYGSPEKIPMVWAIGQKSTNTNPFGVGDDVYVFACHECKLGNIPDLSMVSNLYKLNGGFSADNGVYKYNTDGVNELSKDQKEISDGLRVDVFWSLEDKRVMDAKIHPGNKDWIPNPFPKRWRNSGTSTQLTYQDRPIRLISPLHRVKIMKTLKGDLVHCVQLRGGELDWYDKTWPIEQRGQYPVRYGMGNSKLYISADGYKDNIDGFYTGSPVVEYVSGIYPKFQENLKDSILIKNPSDIILHFLMNHTSINKDKRYIDTESFRKSRQLLTGLRFDTGITEIINGSELIDRFCQQSCSILFLDNSKFKIKTIIPSKMSPKTTLREFEHLSNFSFEYTKTEDIYNKFIFQYFYDHPNQKFSRIIERSKKNDDACRKSFALNGFERSKDVIEFRDIQDDYTANAVADVLVDLYSKRRIYLSCDVAYTSEVIDAKIEIGDCIAITTAQAPNGWDAKPCIVLETNYSSEKLTLKLMEI